MDLTALGIITGVLGAGIYTAIGVIRRKPLNIIKSVVVFLAFFGIPIGASLIFAAISGDRDALPVSWREYTAVAGIVAICLALQYILEVYKDRLSEPADSEDSSCQDEANHDE